MANMELKAVLTAEDKASPVIGGLGTSFTKLAGAFAVGQLAAQAFTKGMDSLIDVGKAGIKVASDMEQTKVAFDTMLGSAKLASQTLKQLSDFAASTPFTLPEVLAGAKQLAAYGFEAGDLTKQMKMLGDVASGLSIPMNELVYVYGTLRAQGRAYTRDLMQFAMRGIPIYDELAKVLNVSKDKIQDLVEAGKVGFPEIQKAFQNMTGEGGKFYNLMDKQSKTFGGTMSNLQDQLTRTLMGIMGISTQAETFGDVIAGGLFDRIRTAAQGALDYVNAHQQDIVNFIAKAIQSGIDWIINVAIPWVQVHWPAIKNSIESTKNAIDIIITAFTILKNIIYAVYFVVTLPIRVFGELVSTFYELKASIYDLETSFILLKRSINNSMSGIYDIITSPFKSAFNWVLDKIGQVRNTLSNLGGRISNFIPHFQQGGIMPYEGLAYLHAGERIIPAGMTNNNSMSVNIYGNINNQQGLSPDQVAQTINRQIDLSRMGAY